ncbi:MAG: sigma-54 dependent transcriptional regulator [Acidobacteriota bacterium]
MEPRRTIQVLLTEGGRPQRILLERDLAGNGKVAVSILDGDQLPAQWSDAFDRVRQNFQIAGSGAEDGAMLLERGSADHGEMVMLSAASEGRLPKPAEKVPYAFLTRPLTRIELQEMTAGEEKAPVRPGNGSILGESSAVETLLDTIERVAAAPASVLIHGETGTGKTLAARAIHDGSDRRDQPFVVVNCSAFQDQLLESELFGHEKGAFTGAVAAKRGLFEVADGGTLFLDEVAEMSSAMQAKLLQTLDDGALRRVGGTKTHKVDVRIVAASNKDLRAEVKAGRFRQDLLFRLRVVSLEVPPLRERNEDIPLLIDVFLERYRLPGRPAKTIAPGAVKLLQEYAWPGNVRELMNTVEGLVLLSPENEIRAEDLPPNLRPSADVDLPDADAPLPMAEIERLHVARALRYTEGKKAPAARLLGIDVKTLNSKIKNYNIQL